MGQVVRPALTAISVLLLAMALGIVLFTTLRSPLKDDVAWLLYVARNWLAGRELYVDVVEVNPPLIIWISAIPIRVASWLGIDPQFPAMACFIAAVLGCAWWTASLLRGYSKLFADRLTVFGVLGTVLLVVPAGDLGQREHLLVAAILPYLALFARSLGGERTQLRAALVAGVLAGLGCALKPRYAGVFVVLESLALLRGLRLFRPMPLAAAVALLGYAALVALVCPAYLRRAVPLALALYGATDVPFQHLLADSLRLMFGEAVAFGLWWYRRRRLPERDLILTLLVFAVTSTVICFIDGKDWFYHRLPATIATILALLCWGGSVVMHRRVASRSGLLTLAVAGVAFLVFLVAAFQRLEPEIALAVQPDQNAVARLEQIVRDQKAHTYIAFSEWIALGFPVVNNTGVAWASRFDSMWALKGELWRARFDPAAAKEWPIRRWVARDFIRGCPDLAVVDLRGGVNYVAILSASDAAFARTWSRYRQIDAFDGLAVYRRVTNGCVDPWVAVEAQTVPDKG
jgi:hypothetical protein